MLVLVTTIIIELLLVQLIRYEENKAAEERYYELDPKATNFCPPKQSFLIEKFNNFYSLNNTVFSGHSSKLKFNQVFKVIVSIMNKKLTTYYILLGLFAGLYVSYYFKSYAAMTFLSFAIFVIFSSYFLLLPILIFLKQYSRIERYYARSEYTNARNPMLNRVIVAHKQKYLSVFSAIVLLGFVGFIIMNARFAWSTYLYYDTIPNIVVSTMGAFKIKSFLGQGIFLFMIFNGLYLVLSLLFSLPIKMFISKVFYLSKNELALLDNNLEHDNEDISDEEYNNIPAHELKTDSADEDDDKFEMIVDSVEEADRFLLVSGKIKGNVFTGDKVQVLRGSSIYDSRVVFTDDAPSDSDHLNLVFFKSARIKKGDKISKLGIFEKDYNIF